MPKRKYSRASYRCVVDALELAYAAGGEARVHRLLQEGNEDSDYGSYLSKRQSQFLSHDKSLKQLKAALGGKDGYDFEIWKHGVAAVAIACRPRYAEEEKIFLTALANITAGEPPANYKALVSTHSAASKIVRWSLMSPAQKEDVRKKLEADKATAVSPKDRFDAEVVLETIGE